jgi:hypothetical protein
MNYCSIEDAWGKNNFTLQVSNNDKKNIETFTDTKITKNYDNHLNEIHDCDNFINHIKNCRKCYSKMRNQFKPKIIENFQTIIDDNRDTIVLILIGIFIVLFFNLINNISK